MLKRTFWNNPVFCFLIAVMCAVIVTSSGCGKVGTMLGKPKPKTAQFQSHHNLTNPTWQLNQKQPLIPAFEMPVTGQGSPFFPSALQPQPLVRSFEMPVGQGTPRPSTNPRIPRNDQNAESRSNIVDDIVDVAGEVFDDLAKNEIRERQRERFNPPPPVLGRGFPVINTADTMDNLWYLKKHTPSAVTECDGK